MGGQWSEVGRKGGREEIGKDLEEGKTWWGGKGGG